MDMDMYFSGAGCSVVWENKMYSDCFYEAQSQAVKTHTDINIRAGPWSRCSVPIVQCSTYNMCWCEVNIWSTGHSIHTRLTRFGRAEKKTTTEKYKTTKKRPVREASDTIYVSAVNIGSAGALSLLERALVYRMSHN